MSPFRNRILHTALAAVVVCGAVACATGPRKTEAERQADAETASRVQLALNDDRQLYARHITVRADDGVVDLSGYVWTQPELEEAIRVAGLVPGVTRVVDRIEVDRGGISNSPVSR
ncbi:MAG TPA: BON domain-containing protein [Steroidobacteraceae bacterium]|nr:BON domain-containing protein [Steroidobacteraceae bacterium]